MQNRIFRRHNQFLRGERGATAIGYGLVVGLIGVAIIGALTATGPQLAAMFSGTAGRLGFESASLPGADNPAAPPQLQLASTVGDPTQMNVLASQIPSTSDRVTFTVTNTGAGAAEAPITMLADGSQFQIAENDCTDALPSDGSCNIAIQAVATNNGSFSDTLRVTADGMTRTASLSGTASGFDGDIFIDQAVLELPPPDASDPGTCTDLVVTNQGYSPLYDLTLTAITGPDAARFQPCTAIAYACTGSLAPQESCAFGLQTVPGAAAVSLSATATVSATGVSSRSRSLHSAGVGN